MNSEQIIEYELTFLAKLLPAEIHSSVPERIIDIYIAGAEPDTHPRLRLRRRGDLYEITKKVPLAQDDASAHVEHTFPLDRREFEALLVGNNRKVEKDRYTVNVDGRKAEIDVFSAELTGLVLVEFEFPHESDKIIFAPPTFCLADVTQEPFVAGAHLAGKSYDDIATDLARYTYQPLTL